MDNTSQIPLGFCRDRRAPERREKHAAQRPAWARSSPSSAISRRRRATALWASSRAKDFQAVFLDTPGIHTPHNRLGEYMMQAVRDSLQGIDALAVVVDASRIQETDQRLVAEMSAQPVYKILVLNKIDLVPKPKLLTIMQSFSQAGYQEIVPVSALTRRRNGGTEKGHDCCASARPQILSGRRAHRSAGALYLRGNDPRKGAASAQGRGTARDRRRSAGRGKGHRRS